MASKSQFSQDQYDEYRDLIIQDQKRSFRNTQIAEEGNDPVETGKPLTPEIQAIVDNYFAKKAQEEQAQQAMQQQMAQQEQPQMNEAE